MRSSPSDGPGVPPLNRSNHFAFHVTHPALISGTKGFHTNPVHLARWLHWNRFWSKFTHDYHLSVATGKLQETLKSNHRLYLAAWDHGLVFVFVFVNLCRQTPMPSSRHTPRGQSVASAARVPGRKSWLLLSLWHLDKCQERNYGLNPIIRAEVLTLTQYTSQLFRNRVVADVVS